MNQRGNAERRATPRVGARLPIQLSESETSRLVTTESMNLSRSGIACRTSEFVAPLAKIELTLILPPFGNLSKSSRILRAEGIVVRCEPISVKQVSERADAEYDLACCFTTLEEDSRNLLDAFVAWKFLRGMRDDDNRTTRRPVAARRTKAAGRSVRPSRSTAGVQTRKSSGTTRTSTGRGARSGTSAGPPSSRKGASSRKPTNSRPARNWGSKSGSKPGANRGRITNKSSSRNRAPRS